MSDTSTTKRIVVGVTGASGAVYAKRLIECLTHAEVETHLVMSDYGKRLFRDELGMTDFSTASLLGRDSSLLTIHPFRDAGAVLASGSFLTDGMIICPCSSHTLGAVAAGLGDNLLLRAAAVTLKEMRRLVLVYREMPMSRIDLQNALKLTEAGAVLCPASPGFYMKPESLDDIVNFVVGKVLDLVKVPHDLNTRWLNRLDQDRNVDARRDRF